MVSWIRYTNKLISVPHLLPFRKIENCLKCWGGEGRVEGRGGIKRLKAKRPLNQKQKTQYNKTPDVTKRPKSEKKHPKQ